MSATATLRTAEENGRWPASVWFMVLLLTWLAIGLAATLHATTLDLGNWPGSVRIPLLEWGPWFVLAPFVLWFSQRAHLGPHTWPWALPAHIFVCLGLMFAFDRGMSWAYEQDWMQPAQSADWPRPNGPSFGMPPRGDFRPPRNDNDSRPGNFGPSNGPGQPPPFRDGLRFLVAIPLYWVLVAAAHAVSYHRRGIEREQHAQQAEARLTEARLAALQAQLNPHFLFNSLNAITHYINANPRAAEEMVASLSMLLRSVLAAADRREVPLSEELRFVDHYLDIQRLRFTDRLTVRREIDSAALEAAVPTLILQPLVENAVIHGVAPERSPGAVIVRAQIADQRLVLEIADTGRGAGFAIPAGTPLDFKEGIGLSNTRDRLRVLYGADHEFSLTAAPEGGVCARLSLPLHTLSPS